jgi:hypothetical protein
MVGLDGMRGMDTGANRQPLPIGSERAKRHMGGPPGFINLSAGSSMSDQFMAGGDSTRGWSASRSSAQHSNERSFIEWFQQNQAGNAATAAAMNTPEFAENISNLEQLSHHLGQQQQVKFFVISEIVRNFDRSIFVSNCSPTADLLPVLDQ